MFLFEWNIKNSISSVCVFIGLGQMINHTTLPVFTLPFNIATSIMFLSLKSAGYGELNEETEVHSNLNETQIYDLDQSVDFRLVRNLFFMFILD